MKIRKGNENKPHVRLNYPPTTLLGWFKRQLCMWRLLRILHPALPALRFPGDAITEKDGDVARGTALFQAKYRESLGDIAASKRDW